MDLRYILHQQRVSPSELARRCGVTRQTVNSWCNRGNVTLENAQKIANALGIYIGELVSEEEDNAKELHNLIASMTPEEIAKMVDYARFIRSQR